MLSSYKIYLTTSVLLIILFFSRKVQAQTCESNLFGKHYNYDGIGYGAYMDTVPGGGFILGDNRGGRSLIRTDENGEFLWAKSYSFMESLMTNEKGSGKVDKDGNYVVSVHSAGLALLNPQGNVIAMKQLQAQHAFAVVIERIYVLPDNKKLVFLDDQSFYGGDAYALVCLSPDLSTIVWTKYMSGGSMALFPTSFTDNIIYFGGRSGDDGLFIAIDAVNGNIVKQAKYKIGNTGTSLLRIFKAESGYLATAYYSSPSGFDNTVVMRLDDNLNPTTAYAFYNISVSISFHLIPEEGGGYYGTSDYGGYRFHVSSTDQITWSRQTLAGYLHAPFAFMRYRGGLLTASQGNWFNVGIGTNSASLAIVKTDENGGFPCFLSNYTRTKQLVSAVKLPYSTYIRDTSFLTVLGATPIVNTVPYNLPTHCSDIKPCTSLDLQGQTEICGTGTYLYIGRRNAGCALPVNWSISGAPVTKTKLNDSTLQVDFTQAGNYQLIGKLGGGCETVADTVNITVSGNTQALDIGPRDSLLCTGNTIVLNAGAGFTSYLWQDGSTAPVYIVTAPGQYFVEALTSCGTMHYDTIDISQAPPVAMSIGPDRRKCNNDTLQLQAPSGFLNYTWGNNYNINTLQGQSVIVNPLVDTIYFVRGEKTPGCFGYDTVRIYVANSVPISLGPDTSICNGNTLTLNAGTGFSSYLWNTGATSSQILINTAGLYHVTAIAATGCKSYDTLELRSVHPLPVVSLNQNSGLCKGDTRILNAGQHASYLWHDGSTQGTFPVQTTGIYYVQVSDVNGCTNSDTTRITRIDDLPSGFLPASMEICNYGNSLLQTTRNFETYQWNTGSQSKSVSISNPGTYWVRVIDINGCAGADTILVTQKQCLQGLFVPTAFTPNNDGRNDLFRAMLFGNIYSFDFKIYNRYGSIVFASNNTNKGWDGTIAGVKQDAGVYIWTCTYSLLDQPIKSEKGTFVLIR